jgi:diguanylate cyclase (GGDEF)-like protein
MVKEFGIDVHYSKEAEMQREIDGLKKREKIDKRTELLKGDEIDSILEDLMKKVNSPENKEGDADNLPDKIMAIAFDMNRLKFFNDTYGHHNGDKAIAVFSQRLKKVFRDVDFIFRTNNEGGDEFMVLMQIFNKNVNPENIFERVKRQINDGLSIEIEGGEFSFSSSAGYVMIEKGDTRSAAEIKKEADMRMYEDKKKVKENLDYSI